METRQAIDAPGWYLPEFLVAFYVDGSGNQYCFDTREASAEGEYQVVFWDHELSTEEKLEGLTITEPTFEKWLFRHARETSAPESAPGSNWGACGCGVVIVVLAVLLIVGLVTCIQWLWRLL